VLPSCEHPATNGTIFQGRTGPDAFVRHLIDLKSVRYRGFCAGDDKRDVQGDQKKEERTDKANTDTKEEVGQKKDNIEEKKETLEQEMFRQLRGSTKVYSYESENPENVIVAAAKSLWRKLTGQVGLTHIERVDAAFDEEQFLEHASHAFVTVNELLGEDDFEALEPMLCPRLLAAFKQVQADYVKQGLTYSIEVEAVREASIEHAFLLSPEEGVMQMLEQEIPRDERPGADLDEDDGDDHLAAAAKREEARYRRLGVERVEGSFGWLVVGVRFQSQERSRISNSSGLVVADTTDRRGHVWELIRGPLPPEHLLPSKDLSCPWKVLNLGPQQAGNFVQT